MKRKKMENEQHSNQTISVVGRVNFPSTQLFEATGFIDLSKQFPTANAFLMFVPGIPDQSKQSGRTYDQSQKEVMKIAVRDLYSLADALKYAATYGQCDFLVFTDSSKFAGTAQGQGQTKQVSVGTAIGNNGKPKIFLNYKGSKKITLALEKWHAIGLAGQIETLADETLKLKFQHE
jgi:mannose/fructose/N-acetylgalactosamine-specific phosphotransferase system component IIB